MVGEDDSDGNHESGPKLAAAPFISGPPLVPNDRHLVLLVHGIRDFALWQDTVGRSLAKAGFRVEFTNYGRFDLFRFLIPIGYFRRKAIEEVLRQIRIAKQTSGADEISIVAHSFGTYVISHILQENFDLKFRRVIFCGSVVRYGFPFEQFYQRFEPPILNDVGTRDIWPAMAESVTWGYGSAGTYGFRRPLVKDRWHNGAGHGFFLEPEFCGKFWVPFLEGGRIEEASEQPESPRLWIQLLYILRVKYVAIALVALALILITGGSLNPRTWRPGYMSPAVETAVPLSLTLSLATGESPYLARRIADPPEPVARRYSAESEYPTGYYLWPEVDFDILLFAFRAGEETSILMEKADFVDDYDETRRLKTTRMWSMFEAVGHKLREVATVDDQNAVTIRELLPAFPADDGQAGLAFLRLVYPDTDHADENQAKTMQRAVRLADLIMPRGLVLSSTLDDRLNEAARLLSTRRIQPVFNLSIANGTQPQVVTAVKLEVLEILGAFSALESGPLTPIDSVQFELGSERETIVKALAAPVKIAANDAVAVRVNLRSKFMFGYLCRLTLLAGDKVIGESADFLVDFGFQPQASG